MRLLSALVLTHYFGCVFPKCSNDEVEFKKLYRSRENNLKRTWNNLAVNTADKCIYDTSEENIYFAKINFMRKHCIANRRKINYHYYELEQSGLIRLQQHSFPLNVKEHTYVQLVSQQHNKRLSILRSHQDVYCLKNSINHRKLLSYTEKTIYKNSSRNEQFRETNTQLRKKDQASTKKPETKDNNEQWDEWANWTACSVTCGSGRQVRWRHCLVGNCTNGLKKAQIKPCRLKNCNSKNILRWLGIKS